jgi:hypothetical protein
MTSFLKLAIALAAASLAVSAAEVWDSKDYKDWSDQDVNRILTKSPWAQETKASMEASGAQRGGGQSSGSRMPGGSGGMGSGGAGGMGGSGGMGTPRSGGRNGNADSMGDITSGARTAAPLDVAIRWDSALPIRQALAKSKNDDGAKLNEPQKSYVISVTGLRLPKRGSGGDDAESSPMSNILMSTAKLVRKDKDPIAPADVKIDGNTILFMFPRTDAIRAEDKEVTFVTYAGRAKVERKFKLKDMVYKGQLEL